MLISPSHFANISHADTDTREHTHDDCVKVKVASGMRLKPQSVLCFITLFIIVIMGKSKITP